MQSTLKWLGQNKECVARERKNKYNKANMAKC